MIYLPKDKTGKGWIFENAYASALNASILKLIDTFPVRKGDWQDL